MNPVLAHLNQWSRPPLTRRRPPRSGSLPVALPGLLGLLLLTAACTTTIVPPPSVSEPTPVALVDQGRHASLVLPTDDGRMIHYAYGNWTWFARRRQGPLEGLAALLVPTQGTLGRRVLPGPLTLANVERQVAGGAQERWLITVQRSRVAALREDLERIYALNRATELANPVYDLDFVHHPDAYCYFHNSNHVTADWLRRLDCQIRGLAFDSRWRVARTGP